MFKKLQILNQKIEKALDDPGINSYQYSCLVNEYMNLVCELDDDEMVTYLNL